MGTFYFIIFFVLVLGFYAFCNLKFKKRDYVMCVEAGSTQKATAADLERQSFYVRRKILRDRHGNVLDPQKVLRIKVSGNCMKPYNISSGDEMLVELIDHSKPIDGQIKEKDVLLIHLRDSGINKIRAFKRFADDGTLETYWFESDGSVHRSSKNHTKDSLVGVVKYRI